MRVKAWLAEQLAAHVICAEGGTSTPHEHCHALQCDNVWIATRAYVTTVYMAHSHLDHGRWQRDLKIVL
jgi:hypothetical protein